MPEQPISKELDQLTCDLLGQALDALASGEEVPVLVACDAGDGPEVVAFEDDGEEECLEAARDYVRALEGALRYVVLYDGAVEEGEQGYHRALLIEFAEAGSACAWSGYVLYEGFGARDAFSWADPQPAGECPSLL